MQPRQPAALDAAATRRIWWAIGVGTIVQAISFSSLIGGAVISLADDGVSAGPAFALGFGLVPVACAVVAFVSGHERAPLATLKGMGVWAVVGLPLGLINPVSGLSTGFAAAASFTLRSLAQRPGKRRALATGILALYVTALVLLIPPAALFAGALTPLLVIRTADIISERSEATATPE